MSGVRIGIRRITTASVQNVIPPDPKTEPVEFPVADPGGTKLELRAPRIAAAYRRSISTLTTGFGSAGAGMRRMRNENSVMTDENCAWLNDSICSFVQGQ